MRRLTRVAGRLPLLLLALAATCADAQSIAFVPGNLTLAAGETRIVSVELQNATGIELAAFQVTLAYDASVIRVADPNAAYFASVSAFAPLGGVSLCETIRGVTPCPDPQWLLSDTGRVAKAGPVLIDNNAGVLQIVYGTHGFATPATGDGVIALIEVIGQQTGSSVISISGSLLADARRPPSPIAHAVGSLTVNVAGMAGNRRPVIVAVGRRAVNAGETTVIALTATDPNGDVLSFSMDSGPVFATVANNGDGTAVLRLTPTRFDIGTFAITILASDGSLTASETIKLRVLRP